MGEKSSPRKVARIEVERTEVKRIEVKRIEVAQMVRRDESRPVSTP
ncbi:hypothetical protein [Streptomyces sp. NBC_01012]|nr:hypothetical protein OG623_02715 [Streptomyces sp. NBC_01012]